MIILSKMQSDLYISSASVNHINAQLFPNQVETKWCSIQYDKNGNDRQISLNFSLLKSEIMFRKPAILRCVLKFAQAVGFSLSLFSLLLVMAIVYNLYNKQKWKEKDYI